MKKINFFKWKLFYYPSQKDGGFVLIVAIIVLALLSIIGISATNMTSVELQIAGNDKVHKTTFYHADAGTEIGMLMIEDNVSCPKGFSSSNGFDDTDPDEFLEIQGIQVADTKFFLDENTADVPGSPATIDDLPADNARTIRIPVVPQNNDDTKPHTNLVIYGNTRLSTGSAIQMAAAYAQGVGKSAAGSGSHIAYNVFSQHLGTNRSESVLQVQWKHLIGQEGTCNY